MATHRRGGLFAGLLAALVVASGCSPAATPSATPSGTAAGASPAASSVAEGSPEPDALFDTSTPPEVPPATAWARALAAIDDDGRYSLDAALTLFATAYGPLPGVDAQPDLTGVTDRSIAIRAMMAHRDELTPEQRAAVDRIVEIPADAEILTVPPVGAARSHVVLAAVPDGRQAALRSAAADWRARMAALLGRDFLGTIDIAFVNQKGPESELVPGAFARAQTWSDWPGGVFGDCQIKLYSDFAEAAEWDQDGTMAHEVFHCFQLDAYRTIESYSTAPAWVIEGQAAWVGASMVNIQKDYWIDYLQIPTMKLTKRNYDAIGFYAHLAETGTDPWSVFWDMWLAGSNNVDIYVASRATTDAFLDSVASAVTLTPELGTAWTTGGPGMVDQKWRYRPPVAGVAEGRSLSLAAPSFTSAIREVRASSDLVHVSVNGHGRLADGTIDTTVVQDVWYCVTGHTCEPKCAGDGPAVVVRGEISPRFGFALAGGLTGATASIQGVNLPEEDPDKECEEEEENDEFCRRYRDYVAWAESLGEDADVTREMAGEVARRFEGMYPVAPEELKKWVELVFTIYATYAGFEEPYNIPITGQVSGIENLPEALMTMHAYCGIPWGG